MMLMYRCPLALCLIVGLSACGKGKNDMDEKHLSEIEKQTMAYMESHEYKQAYEAELKRIEAEHQVIEEAPWFGKTGLDEDTERHLPRYLRLEFGESLFDQDSLKAADLTYIGAFPGDNGSTVHFWKIPYGDEDVYARVVDHPINAGFMDWGIETPPK